MSTAIQFAVLGLGIGATYTLLAQGLVFVYWGSGVLNLSHAAMAMMGAFLFWDLRMEEGWSFLPAFATSIAVIALLGGLVYQCIIRPLRHASSLARVVSTLGVLLLLQGLAQVIWGVVPHFLTSSLPSHSYQVGEVFIPVDRLYLLGIAFGITVGLWALSRFTALGLAIRAGADNPRAAAALGWSPDALATFTWSVGAGLAAAAGILIAPLVGLTVDEMPLLIIPILAAALIGGFQSFWLTFFGAVAIGITQGEVANYVEMTGANWAVPLAVIVVLLAIRGKGLPVRGYFVERLAEVGTGRVRLAVVVPMFLLSAALILWVFPDWGGPRLLDALTATLAWGTIMLSVVVLLGYTSQLSFEQMGMAGLAALIAGRIVADTSWPFEIAVLIALVAAVPIGVLFALPALRTRGINLAVVTLALGMVVFQMIFQNARYTGASDGTPVGPQSVFGISIDPIEHPARYCIFALVFFTLCALVVANVRRGSAGRRLLAVRTNERAAAALGISVFGTKLFAFIVGATMASVGGIVLAFQVHIIDYAAFNPFNSIVVVAWAVIGGIGFVGGALFGGQGPHGAFGTWLLNSLFPDANPVWLAVAGGIFVILLVLLHPDGAVSIHIKEAQRVARLVRRLRRQPVKKVAEPLPRVERAPVTAKTLDVSGLVVRFGGVTAVDDVSLSVRSGEVIGLIGPNGAGKTSFIDAATGFTRPAAGEVELDGKRIDGWPVHRRTRAGIARSFQSLELFEQSTVRENLQVAADPRTLGSYFSDLIRPQAHQLTGEAIAAVHELELESELDERVSDLSYGHRRLVAIARAIALEPSLLLLDEPAAGLTEHESMELAVIVRRLADEWGLGILVVEHDMAFVMGVCDRIVVMDFGRQIATGTPAEIRRDPKVIAAYLGEPEALEAERQPVGTGGAA